MTAAPKRRAIRTKANKKTPAKRAAPSRQSSKLDQLVNALRTPKGATLADLMKLTGWQAHTVRGFISIAGSKQGLKIESFRSEDKERTYRIA